MVAIFQAVCVGDDTGWALSLIDVSSRCGDLSTATILGLQPGQTYHFRVAMENRIGLSEYSTIVHGTTLMAVPSAPRQLYADAMNSTTVALTWLPPTSTGGAQVVQYRVEHSINGSDWKLSAATITEGSDAASDGSWLVSHLQPATEYHFRVFAVNTIGDSPASPCATASTPSTVPTAPTELQVTNITSDCVDLCFKVTFDGGNTVSGHEIQQRLCRKTTCCDVCGRDVGILATACTHCSHVVLESEAVWSVSQTQKLHEASLGCAGTQRSAVLDLLAGAVYMFRCRSANANGFSEWSRPTGRVSMDKCTPDAPATFAVGVTGAREVVVSWTMPAKTGGWPVERAAFQKLLVRNPFGVEVEADWTVAMVQLSDTLSVHELVFPTSVRSMEINSAALTSPVDTALNVSATLSGLQPAAMYCFRMMLERATGLRFFALHSLQPKPCTTCAVIVSHNSCMPECSLLWHVLYHVFVKPIVAMGPARLAPLCWEVEVGSACRLRPSDLCRCCGQHQVLPSCEW